MVLDLLEMSTEGLTSLDVWVREGRLVGVRREGVVFANKRSRSVFRDSCDSGEHCGEVV